MRPQRTCESGLTNRFGDGRAGLALDQFERSMAPNAKDAVQEMAAMQKWQYGLASAGKLVEHAVDAAVTLRILGGHQKSFNSVLFVAGGNMNFGEI
jgi:hypothetical protein